MTGKHNALKFVRDFLFSRANREFLIFLFFLALSGIFWLIMALNETYEREIAVPFRVVNVPKDIMLTSDETDTVKMTMRDKGLVLLGYLYGDNIQTVTYSFKNYDRGNGMGMVSNQELHRLVTKRISSSTRITSISPSKLEFYYSTGAKKKVPVRWSGRVTPEQLYFISHVDYWPDSVTVFASESMLDSIKIAYTEPLDYVGFRDTLTVNCRMRKIQGMKTVPEVVKIGFYTDVLTEESIDGIPVKGINMPEGKVLRTFPAKVRVKIVAGVSVYRSLKPSDFEVIADYNELIQSPSEKCNIYLKRSPSNISRATLEVNQVDFLIEEDTSETMGGKAPLQSEGMTNDAASSPKEGT